MDHYYADIIRLGASALTVKAGPHSANLRSIGLKHYMPVDIHGGTVGDFTVVNDDDMTLWDVVDVAGWTARSVATILTVMGRRAPVR